LLPLKNVLQNEALPALRLKKGLAEPDSKSRMQPRVLLLLYCYRSQIITGVSQVYDMGVGVKRAHAWRWEWEYIDA